jgi:endonuclease/exonuclease/phosphatase (EEP) superfamily protein YafD
MTITSTPPEVRPARRVVRAVLLALLVLPGLVWALLRLLGAERGYVVQLFAFTPYVAAWAWIPVILALLARTWLVATVAAVAAVLLAACVLPRALPDADRGPSDGAPLTVMTINMYIGQADPAAMVALVREHDVAVLAVQEFTTAAGSGLTAAGLDALLPYHALAGDDALGTTGSGLYSRYPISGSGSERGAGGNLQAYATIHPPGAAALSVESAHPLAPYAKSVLGLWKEDLDREPGKSILLGDFNSTLDHAPVRDLIRRGYRDAADATGKGLLATWGPVAGRPIPPVTLDHVLVDKRIGVRAVSVEPVRLSDHRAVLAELSVPRS